VPKSIWRYFKSSVKSEFNERGKNENKLRRKLEGVNWSGLMNSDTFYEIEENLVHLNAAFLKSTSRYEVLSVDDMFASRIYWS
jgi:hypothetical protein